MMRTGRELPVLGTAGRAYRLLGRHPGLHAKAVWAPVVFLVAAETTWHRMTGKAHGGSATLHAVLAAPWWMKLLAVACWLAGLKFLLSFSISWRRHILLGERFDPFFFQAPFWRYLGLLLLTYAWLLPLMLVAFLAGGALAAGTGSLVVAPLPLVAAALFAAWAIARQVPFFTALCFDRPEFGWRDCVAAMRGTAWRYLLIFGVTMLPVAAVSLGGDALLKATGADPHSWPVALGESAFRQVLLFVHFSLGASLGMLVFEARMTGTGRAAAAAG